MRKLLSATLCAAAALTAADKPSPEIVFERITLDLGRNESCAFADVDGDGLIDVVAGENWFEAPTWRKHPFREIGFFNNYIDDFSNLALDVDSDGDFDVIAVSWNARRMIWLENPGRGEGEWREHEIDSGQPVEFAFLVDLNGDGSPREILPQFGGREGYTAWYELEDRGAETRWRRHIVSPATYGHGIGAGDVDGDGRVDILTPKGWLRAPEDPRQVPWTLHEDYSFDKRLGFLHVLDVDEDGLNDLIVPHAHDYGLYWYKQTIDEQGRRSFEQRLIDDAWSQAHATTLVDLTGDGFPELLTGKRLWAHNGHDPGGREPPGIYWYERIVKDGKIEWARHLIRYGGRVGTGMQIPAVDIDGDGDLDFAVAGKGGVFLFLNQSSKP